MHALLRYAVALTVSLISTGVVAQTFDVSETTAVTGTTNHPTTVTFTQGATPTTSFDFTLTYNPTLLTFVSATSNAGTVIACSNPSAGTVLCFADAGGATVPLNAITPNPAVITISYNVTGPAGSTALLTLAPGSISDTSGNPQTAAAGSDLVGEVVITAAPVAQAPTLTFNPPAPGPVALSQGGTGSIAVTAGAGTAGTTTSLTCTPSTGFGATVTGSPFAPNSSGTVNLTCTPQQGAAQTGTVSCDPTQSAGTDQPAQVFNVTCPAAPVAPSEFDAPLSLALVGAPSSTAAGSITVRNLGTGTLTIACGAPTGGFVLTQAPAATVAPGGQTSIGLSCVTPGASGATTSGTLQCTTNDADEGTVTFALSCSAQLLAVPALGNTAKGLMIALLAGLGLLGFAMRRRVV